MATGNDVFVAVGLERILMIFYFFYHLNAL